MHEPFILELTYQNKVYELPAAFQRHGYTYRIVVTISEHNYVFESDEEGQYRVLSTPEEANGCRFAVRDSCGAPKTPKTPITTISSGITTNSSGNFHHLGNGGRYFCRVKKINDLHTWKQ